MEVEAFQRLDPENFYRRFIKNGVRPDGRELRAVRPISVDVEVLSSEHVQASALVGLGSTKVLAGITLEIGQPAESSPLCGMLGRHADMLTKCAASIESGRYAGSPIAYVGDGLVSPEQSVRTKQPCLVHLKSSAPIDYSTLGCIQRWRICYRGYFSNFLACNFP